MRPTRTSRGSGPPARWPPTCCRTTARAPSRNSASATLNARHRLLRMSILSSGTIENPTYLHTRTRPTDETNHHDTDDETRLEQPRVP